jgi:hypothetical protein
MKTTKDNICWDFSWDDSGDLGVWVLHKGREVLVEAMQRVGGEDFDGNVENQPTGEYTLASMIELEPGDTVQIKGCLYAGRSAGAALWAMRLAEEEGTQIPVNEQQRALLTLLKERSDNP